MIATSGFLTALECTKSIFGRGSAGGAYSAPPDPLVGFKGGGKGEGGDAPPTAISGSAHG